MRKLGIIGGMSWASTELYYRHLNKGVQKRLGTACSAPIVMESLNYCELSRISTPEQWAHAKDVLTASAKRLEDAGVIAGYRAVLDPIRMGLAHVAFVEVRLSDTREAALQAFNRAVLAVPEIEECHMMASSFDYLLKVRTSDIADYRRFLGERISALPHVASTSTYVAMEAVKEAGL